MLTLLAALTISTATACSSDASSPEPVAAPVEGVSVELKTPGQAPQSPLAWFVDNTEQKVTYSATQGLEQKTLHGKSGEDLPYGEVTMSLPLTASSTSNGKTHTQKVTVGAPDGSNKELNEDMATAEGFEMRTTVEDDGRATERSFIAPEEASDGAKASIEMAVDPAVPTPEKTGTVVDGEQAPELFDALTKSSQESGATLEVVDPVLPGVLPNMVEATVNLNVPDRDPQVISGVEFANEDGAWKLDNRWACTLVETVLPDQVPPMCAEL